VQNTGNTAWSHTNGYALDVVASNCLVRGDGSFFTTGTLNLDPAVTVLPGEQYTFKGTLLGPGLSGSCAVHAQMLDSGAGPFGQDLASSINVVDAINNSASAGSSLPAKLPPGANIGIGITMRNLGSTIWSSVPEGRYSLSIQEDPCGIFSGLGSLAILSDQTVMPNLIYQFLAHITAPQTLGPCEVSLQMYQAQTGAFGEIVHLAFEVAPEPNATRYWENYE